VRYNDTRIIKININTFNSSAATTSYYDQQ
jgi:hypothetical protein